MSEVLQIYQAAQPLEGPSGLASLVDHAAAARLILIGEASHGNHEYYDIRAAITRQLIERGDISFVAVEADQPDCIAIDQRLRPSEESPGDPVYILREHIHWPSWMLANAENAAFCRWLQAYNLEQLSENQVSWQGLDVFPMWGALRETVDYLSNEQGWSSYEVNDAFEAPLRNEPMVPVELLGPLALHLAQTVAPRFSALAEAYYRSMLQSGDQAMSARSVHWRNSISELLGQNGSQSRGIIWAHNTHVGDARGTNMLAASLGQLVREQHGAESVMLIGFAGGSGTVMAARERGGPMQTVNVPPPRQDSVEELLGEATEHTERALFTFPPEYAGTWLAAERGHRAIGAVYNPDNEIYVNTRLGQRYNALIWCKSVTPIEPLSHGAPDNTGNASIAD
jgi:erythromycin esterase-like protein